MSDTRDRIDEIKTGIDNLNADLQDEIERVSKERDDWKELYEALVERRNSLAITGSC
jgi:hypothetical protein